MSNFIRYTKICSYRIQYQTNLTPEAHAKFESIRRELGDIMYYSVKDQIRSAISEETS
jgi:hypothetical protein